MLAVKFRGLLVAVLLCVSSPIFAQTDPPPDIPIDKWLQGPDRHDFRWKVHLGKPRLTFQQRHKVRIRMAADVRDLLKAGISPRDLHLVVKLAGKDGRWLPGQAYSRFEPPEGFASADTLLGVAGVYVRPGTYRVAVIAYDSLNRRGNLSRRTLLVPRVTNDPLPDAERNLPQVEFRPAPLDRGDGKLFLPVENVRPLQVDVLVNFSLDVKMGVSLFSEYSLDGKNLGSSTYSVLPNQVGPRDLFQISRVLSQIHLRSGCVRLSAVDLLRQQWLVDREDVRQLDWSEIRRHVGVLEQNKIDVPILAGERKTPALLARSLEQLATEPSPCATGGLSPLHILVVVSNTFVFPKGVEVSAVERKRFPEGRVYYLRAKPDVGPAWDQIGSIFKPLDPVRLDFHSAGQFRKAIARLIVDLEQSSLDSAPRPPAR